jgi:hypothetical protein
VTAGEDGGREGRPVATGSSDILGPRVIPAVLAMPV